MSCAFKASKVGHPSKPTDGQSEYINPVTSFISFLKNSFFADEVGSCEVVEDVDQVEEVFHVIEAMYIDLQFDLSAFVNKKDKD